MEKNYKEAVMQGLQTVDRDFDRSLVPNWARHGPIYKYGDKNPPYTYEDWRRMPEFKGVNVQLLDGLLAMMPLPTPKHAGIEEEICFCIRDFVRGKSGKVFSSNFPVHLFPDRDNEEISPDVTVVLDPSRINDQGLQGPPDFVVEILSTNRKQDLVVKFNKYQEAGVGEYWIVDPDIHTVQVNILKNAEYVTRMIDADADPLVPVATLPGLEINFTEAFNYI
jgi:Uma2 family endonuclease